MTVISQFLTFLKVYSEFELCILSEVFYKFPCSEIPFSVQNSKEKIKKNLNNRLL